MKVNLGQVLTAMVTPFNDDLSVNLNQAQQLANYLVENGSDGLVVSGTTGESPTLSDDEKVELYKAVKETVGDRATVIAGSGYNCTRESIELTKRAEKTGVDACMLVTPYYNKPPQEGLFKHFKMIAESTSLPVILYNVPSRTVRNLEAETVVALSEVDNIVGVKEASGDLEQVAKIINETPDNFIVLSGEDVVTFHLVCLGGDGVISVASHLVGQEMKEMIKAVKNQDIKTAQGIQSKLLPVFKILFLTTNPIMVKEALNLKQIDVGGLRPPLVSASEKQRETLKQAMEKLGLL